MRKIELTDKIFGKLRVVSLSDKKTKTNHLMYDCECECGNKITVTANSLRRQNGKSCGCLRSELLKIKLTKHGLSETREYRIWCNMKQRCSNKSLKQYKDYGGKGIKVCERWIGSFDNFIADMGKATTEIHSIDRIDNDGNYEPSNCRWATLSEQCLNKRDSLRITIEGILYNTNEFIKLCKITIPQFNYYYYSKKLTFNQIYTKFNQL